ncbi:MAG: galactarate dehydratase [Spirochaetia bacterium]|jgi:galactarate dehydratase|nr:galactarate dehydratase [Spirochaetia bacterium]
MLIYKPQQIIKIASTDNVAIAIRQIKKGTQLSPDLIATENIPQGHKIALYNLKKGDKIFRYGVELGHLLVDTSKGSWINEKMLSLPAAPQLKNLDLTCQLTPPKFIPPRMTFQGYEVPGSPYAGTRNILGITTTVQCVAGVLRVAVEKMKRELLPKYSNVDDIVSLEHPYGCGVAINAKDADIPIRAIKNLAKNPNFGGELMVVGLGCEKLTVDKLLDSEDNNSDNVIMLQDCKGFNAMIDALMTMADKKLRKLNTRKRTTLPLSALCIGLQCGGSDAFSGITANPSAGYASDLLVSGGATVLFSEVTEVRDGVDKIAHRCVDTGTVKKLAQQMAWYDNYLEKGNVDRNANPTPGNKQGGLCNIVEKAMGSIAKSGTSPIVEVLAPGELPSKHGMIFAATPASDFVCGPMQLASGITLQVFMTGRGTPYGLAVAPVIKVCSRTELKNMWNDLIDVNAGTIATGEKTIQQVGLELFNLILDIASGQKKPWAEKYNLANSLCIFNPAPIT